MDYEKAYKHLIAKVKNAHLYAQTDSTKAVLEDILPELRENEDERIRKFLVNEVFSHIGMLDLEGDRVVNNTKNELWKKALAYLEKQKEQKPASISCGHENDTEWSEEDEEWYMYLLGELNASIKDYCGAAEKDIKEAIRWFKSRYKSLRPQPKQEWGDEDEKILRTIISDGSRGVELDSKQIAWLKSLRPKSHWKPGEYMLSLVKKVANGEMLTRMEQMAMETLCNDLQKLL